MLIQFLISAQQPAAVPPPQNKTKPSFIKSLEDVTAQDGSVDFALSCRVSGNKVAACLNNTLESFRFAFNCTGRVD